MAGLPIALTLVALSPLVSPGAEPIERDVGRLRTPLRLVWYDGERLLRVGGFEQLRQEVESLFAPLGVELTWRKGEGRAVSSTELASLDLELKVLLLPVEPVNWGLEPHVMGVVMGDANPREVIYLFFNNIARTLGYRPKSARLTQPMEGTLMVRAVARVLAHEMVHAMAPRLPHHEGGLMSCKLTQSFLVKPGRIEIDLNTAQAFKMEMARHLSARRENGLAGGRGFLAPFRP